MPLPAVTTARTPAHDLPYLFPGQAQKEAFVNEAFARLDALVSPTVLDDLSAPPAAPASGDCYIVAAPASGDWTGHERDLAVWAENQWLFLAPHAGARVHHEARGALAVYNVTDGWRRASAPPLPVGGTTQDAEARAALAAVVAKLQVLGIFSA